MGKIRWDDSIVQNVSLRPTTDNDSGTAKPDTTCTSNEEVFITCPRCCKNSTWSPSFQLIDLDKLHSCQKCSAKSQIKRWTCECNLPWHCCGQHSQSINCLSLSHGKSNWKAPRMSIKGLKRKTCYSVEKTFEALLAEDLRREAKRKRCAGPDHVSPIISLGASLHAAIKPSFLPPSLRRRFPTCIGSSS